MELKIKVMEQGEKDLDLENELIVPVGKGLKWMLGTENIEIAENANIEIIE